MSDEIRNAIEEQKRVWAQFQKANDERLAKIEAGETKGMADLNAKIANLSAALEQNAAVIERVGELENEMNKIGLSSTTGAGMGDRGFQAYMRQGDESGIRAAANTGSDADGGFLVPENIRQDIDRVAADSGVIRQLAAVQRISNGSSYVEFVTTSGAGAGWVGEKGARPATDTPELARVETVAEEMYANPEATQRMLDDAAVDIEAWLAAEVGIRFAELEASGFVSGDGVAKARGILSYPTVADSSYAWGKVGFVKTGEAAAFPSSDPGDVIINLEGTLKQRYLNGAAWIMSRSTKSTIRKFKNSSGDMYLWQPSFREGEPSTLLGHPVYVDDYMPAIGAGEFPIAFGDFRHAYRVVDHVQVRVLRDPFSNKPNVGFYTTKRVGGGIRNFEAIKLLKVSA